MHILHWWITFIPFILGCSRQTAHSAKKPNKKLPRKLPSSPNNYSWIKNNRATPAKDVLTSALCNLRSLSTGSGSYPGILRMSLFLSASIVSSINRTYWEKKYFCGFWAVGLLNEVEESALKLPFCENKQLCWQYTPKFKYTFNPITLICVQASSAKHYASVTIFWSVQSIMKQKKCPLHKTQTSPVSPIMIISAFVLQELLQKDRQLNRM